MKHFPYPHPRRQAACAVVALLLVSFSAVGISAGAPLAALELPGLDLLDPTAPLEVRVMTFNIRVATPLDRMGKSWNRRKDTVIDVIRQFSPDVLGLQEALKHQVDAIVDGLDGYDVIGVGRSDGQTRGEYSCILYRKDRFELSDSDTFWLSDTPEIAGSKSWGMFTRICTWGRFVDRDTGRAFYMYNTHLDNASSQARERGADLMMDRLAARAYDDPFILTGDLNAGEDSRVLQYLKGQTLLDSDISPVPLVDTFRLIHPNRQDVGTTGGYRGARNHQKIDFILAEPRIDVLDAQIIRDHGRSSDHYPVTATIVMGS
ncbi:MAG: endonuclease/exonuclease/phosphatase family protein [Phycisphaerae bacterium]|nr:endonuclease/exonuclease/phosphatase family protein [Phycisphaerae bacterium]